MTRRLTFAYPGSLQLKTGGYAYDRRLIAGLDALGWQVDLLALGEGFPAPGPAVRSEAERRLSALPDHALLMIDGLAFGVLDDWATSEASRLNIMALVHHPLALETGLETGWQHRLKVSETRALASARHVVVTSPATARELTAHYDVDASTITVAPPGTDKAPVSRCDGSPPKIVSIGSLIARKGHDVLIDALKQIEDLAWQAVIVGSHALHPPTAQALQRQIQSLGLQGRIELVGQVKDTRTVLASADLFALASRYEGYGMVFAEALTQGVPIVACHTGAVPDVVPEHAGFLVPVDDVQAFGGALRSVLQNKAVHRAMAASARKAGEQLPNWHDTATIVSSTLEANS